MSKFWTSRVSLSRDYGEICQVTLEIVSLLIIRDFKVFSDTKILETAAW